MARSLKIRIRVLCPKERQITPNITFSAGYREQSLLSLIRKRPLAHLPESPEVAGCTHQFLVLVQPDWTISRLKKQITIQFSRLYPSESYNLRFEPLIFLDQSLSRGSVTMSFVIWMMSLWLRMSLNQIPFSTYTEG